jgi:hypothetical protein
MKMSSGSGGRSLKTSGSIAFKGFTSTLIALIEKYGLTLARVNKVQNGLQIHLNEGPSLTIFNTGKVLLQGRAPERAQALKIELEVEIAKERHRQVLAALLRGDTW